MCWLPKIGHNCYPMFRKRIFLRAQPALPWCIPALDLHTHSSNYECYDKMSSQRTSYFHSISHYHLDSSALADYVYKNDSYRSPQTLGSEEAAASEKGHFFSYIMFRLINKASFEIFMPLAHPRYKITSR